MRGSQQVLEIRRSFRENLGPHLQICRCCPSIQSSEDITDDRTAEVEAMDDDQVYPTEPVSEPQSGPEHDEAPVEVSYAVEEVPELLGDAWGFPKTVKSGEKKKKKSRKNLT
jgi:hypothetical protein